MNIADFASSFGGRVTTGAGSAGSLNPFVKSRRARANGTILPLEDFWDLLERERARAERSGQALSVAVFDAARHNGTALACLEELAQSLAARVRASDEVGWFTDKSIGVALPATSAEGAWIFADDVARRTESKGPCLDRTVYTYPTKWIKPGDDLKKDGEPPRHPRIHSGDKGSSPKHDGGHPAEPLEHVLSPRMPAWKRALDIAGSLAALVLLSPLFLTIAVFIKIVSPGPIFFKQQRVGHLGKTFTFWKFRTMHVDNDATGHQHYLSTLIHGDAPMTKLDADRDPRIIRCGRFLRQSCLDELPQLINVLTGDMSLVGPRPCLPYEAEEYLAWHARRFDSVPGMTGLWQVNGKNKLTFKEMIRFDIQYARTVSPWLDIKILFRTLPAVATMILEHLAAKREARAGSAVSGVTKKV